MEDVARVALDWYARGFNPVPLGWASKTPLMEWGRWLRERPAPLVVEKMFARRCNVGVIVQPPYAVVDFDRLDAYRGWTDKPTTFEVRTGRGVHVWLNVGDLDVRRLMVEGADVLQGRLVTVPPSMHRSGVRYQADGSEIAVVDRITCAIERPTTERIEGAGLGREKKVVSRMTIEAVLAAYGVQMYRGQGRYAKALCPFHDDHEPSFLLDMKTGHTKCMAPHCPAYVWWADAIDLYAMFRGISLRRAIAELREE